MGTRGYIACAACLVIGLVLGRFVAPEKTRTVVKERYIDVTAETKVEAVRPEVVTIRTVGPAVRKIRIVHRLPDGTTTDTTEETLTGPQVDSTVARADKVRYSDRVAVQERTVTKLVPTVPDWTVTALGGMAIVEPAVPIFGNVVVGASVERRIVGPVSAGVWVNSVGAGGVSVSVRW
jgi:hypothetical protein